MRYIVRHGLMIGIAVSLATQARADDTGFDCISLTYWLYPKPEFSDGEIAAKILNVCGQKAGGGVTAAEINTYMRVVNTRSPKVFIEKYGRKRYEKAGKIAAAARSISEEVDRQLQGE